MTAASFTTSFTVDRPPEDVFDIGQAAEGTTVTLTHVGLLPQFECYDVCSSEWTRFLDVGLLALPVNGDPAPMTAEKAAEIARQFAEQQ